MQRPVLVFWKREKFCSRRMPRGFLIWKRNWRVFPAARFDDCKVFKEMANPVTSSSSGHRTTKCPPRPLGKNADGTKMKGHETRYSPTWRILCDCGAVDGVLPATANLHCPHYPDGKHILVMRGGALRCNGCQYTPDLRAVRNYNGIDRKTYANGSWRHLGQFALNKKRRGPSILGNNDDSDRIDVMVNRTIFGRFG